MADFRRDVAGALAGRVDNGQRARVLTAVNEIVANLLRHARPVPTEIKVNFEHRDGVPCCVIRDNGGSFAEFNMVWDMIRTRDKAPLFTADCVGLSMVQRCFPAATYKTKNGRSKHNMFVLPLVGMTNHDMPHFFCTTEKG